MHPFVSTFCPTINYLILSDSEYSMDRGVAEALLLLSAAFRLDKDFVHVILNQIGPSLVRK